MARSTRLDTGMRKTRTRPWFAIALLALAVPAGAGELYQWKDAKGVTHYSDSPPPDRGSYKSRTIRNGGAASVQAKPAESAQCTTARMNLEHLRGTAPAGFDADRDGKPDATFTAEQRSAQAKVAEGAVQTHCAPAPAAAQG